jgi:SAM-dependent methyltransferase
MENAYELVTNCRSCKHSDLDLILDLGSHPLANALIEFGDANNEKYYPLVLLRCKMCTTIQLSVNVNPRILFSTYSWVTGTSKSTKEYCARLAELALSSGPANLSTILEIGSNDGTLLDEFESKCSASLFGIDPAGNVVPERFENKTIFIKEFFTHKFAMEFAVKYGKVDIIIARNVLSHVPDLMDVLLGVDQILEPNGIFIVEFHDANRILSELQYDSIYHEHTYYHSIQSMEFALNQIGLKVFNAEVGPISGGCVILFASRQKRLVSPRFQELKTKESNLGVGKLEPWLRFAERVDANVTSLRREFESRIDSSISAFGASARSSTLLNSVGESAGILDGIADNNHRKWGKYSPGLNILIDKPSQVVNKSVNSIFLSAFNFENEIVNQLRNELGWSGEVLVPLPNVLRKYQI